MGAGGRPTYFKMAKNVKSLIIFARDCRSRRQVFRGRPIFLFPWWFHVRACLVVLDVGLRSVCPSHLHLLFCISSSAGVWLVLSHRSLLLMVSGQRIWRIFLRQVLMKVWTLLMVVTVVRRSQTHTARLTWRWCWTVELWSSGTAPLKSRCSLVAQTLLLPCLADSCSYIGVCTTLLVDYTAQVGEGLYFFQDLLFQLDGVSVVRIHFQGLCLPPVDGRPRCAEVVATSLVFPCICCWVWDRRARSSAKSRSSSSVHRVHWIPFRFLRCLHRPIDRQQEKENREQAALPDPGLHLKRVCDLFPMYHPAGVPL